jgi:hypothetical protein
MIEIVIANHYLMREGSVEDWLLLDGVEVSQASNTYLYWHRASPGLRAFRA